MLLTGLGIGREKQCIDIHAVKYTGAISRARPAGLPKRSAAGLLDRGNNTKECVKTISDNPAQQAVRD